jgi:hypothetical protein
MRRHASPRSPLRAGPAVRAHPRVRCSLFLILAALILAALASSILSLRHEFFLTKAALAHAEAARASVEASLAAAAHEAHVALAAAAHEAHVALAAAKAEHAAAEARAASPDEAKRVASAAFFASESWRQQQVDVLYANMTDADWATAARWKRYAHPDAPERTCAVAALPSELLDDIALLSHAASTVPSLTNISRTQYLTLHAFHTTGLEGNTLTLSETQLTIAGQSLFAGFDARVLPSRAADRSTIEVHNLAQFWGALKLAELPVRAEPPLLNLARISTVGLVDMNSAITRGTGAPFGLRSIPVAIGHKRVLLPMPDEVPVLVEEFLVWLGAALHAEDAERARAAAAGDGACTVACAAMALKRVLALACDAHTRFVFVHPFADGNGRLARTLAALVLQRYGLPAPMVPRSARADYMAAVSSATIDRTYAPLAAIHAAAVRRSLGCLVEIGGGAHNDEALAAALARADCALSKTTRAE